MVKPKIAVVNSSSTLSSCYSHLDALSRVVQDSIRAAGGLPFEVRTVAPSDFVTSAGRDARYLMPARDLLVNDVEVMVEGAMLDGMVCLSSCDKTTPAHLMAASRLNIPTIVVIGGYQEWGTCGGMPIDIDDVYESVGAVVAGTLSPERLADMTECAIASVGVCAGLGTANTMHIVAETLGMTMPGSAPIRATSTRILELARRAGERIVGLVEEDLRPRALITEAAIRNAVSVCVAIGGSVNAVRHLSAIATEAELNIDVIRFFEEAGRTIPLIAAIRPNGPYRVSDLEAAGGARAILKQLAGHVDLSTLDVTGSLVGDCLPETVHADIVRPAGDPVSTRGGIVILRGSLAPDGAIAKTAGMKRSDQSFMGPAVVFGSEADAIEALGTRRIAPGQVVVLRGLGPRGGPGTVFAASFAAAVVGAGLSDQIALVTDGELSGLNRGIVIGQVMPEAAEGGPLAYVRDGDHITINIPEGRLDVDGRDGPIAGRFNSEPITLPEPPRGWLAIYRELVQPIARGATLLPNRAE